MEEKTLPSPMRLDELFQSIFNISPQGIRFSVNQEFVDSSQIVEDGDEVGFLPPVGGG